MQLPPWNFASELSSALRAARSGALPIPPNQIAVPNLAVREPTLVDHDVAAARSVPPTTLIDGHYEVVTRVGVGGSAEVYKVLDTGLNELRALKLLVPRAGQDAAEARFDQEIRLAQAMRHPNLVRIFDAGIWRGRLYYTMEFLQGMDLRDYIELAPGRGIAVRSALEIAHGIARGLQGVHDAGVVHRDIKPANVQLVPGEERVKLVDFGIALEMAVPMTLTEPDMIVGTPAYVSPERVKSGATPTPAADLYSLGVILYELLTGRRPFDEPSVGQLFTAIVQKRPTPIAALVPHLPRDVVWLVADLMAKEPNNRPVSAARVAERIEAILDEV